MTTAGCHLVAVAAIGITAGAAAAGESQSALVAPLRSILVRAAAYVERFEREFALVVSDESYRQQLGSGPWQLLPRDRVRHTRAEMVFLWMPDEGLWLNARNVLSVDGAPVPASAARVGEALSDPSGRIDRLTRIRADSVRYNLGDIFRDFNDPTFTLQFVAARLQPRFRWQLESREQQNGLEVARIAFSERASPTLVRRGTVDLISRGTIWIESATGVVRRTSLAVDDPLLQTRGRVDVEFGPVSRIDVRVPLAMDERYTQARTFILARATYSNFRRFETSGRLMSPP